MDTTQYGADGERLAEIHQDIVDKADATLESLGVPKSISRKQVIAACEALGLDAQRVGYLEMNTTGVIVELFDVGTRFQRGLIDSGQLRPVTVVEIPVVGDDA